MIVKAHCKRKHILRSLLFKLLAKTARDILYDCDTFIVQAIIATVANNGYDMFIVQAIDMIIKYTELFL